MRKLSCLLLLLAGCGPARRPGELTVLCGGSFRQPMERLVERYQAETGGKAILSFGQSEELLPQVKLKAAGDLFMSHDPFMQSTAEAGALSRYVVVGHMVPVLVTAKGNPKKLAAVEDLARDGLRVILPSPEFSTCGQMVVELLERKKIKDAVLRNTGDAMVRSHKDVAEHIKLGSRDAGIMWKGVAYGWRDALEIVPAPYEYKEEIRAAVMGLSYSQQAEAVEAFLKFTEQAGPAVFAEFGYVK